MIARLFTPVIGAVLLLPLIATAALAQSPAGAPQPPARAQEAPFAKAKSSDARLFLSGSMRPAVDQVMAQMEAAIGRAVALEVRQARALQDIIAEGAAFEVALATGAVMDALVAAGKVHAVVPLGDIPLGVSARGNVSKLDISTPDGLKKTLLEAKAIRRFHGAGATVPLTDHVIEKLGVGEAIQHKVNAPGAPRQETVLAPHEYELDLVLASEASPRNGWTYVGAVPKTLRLPNPMVGGISAKAEAEVASRIMAFLSTAAFKTAMAATGVEPF